MQHLRKRKTAQARAALITIISVTIVPSISDTLGDESESIVSRNGETHGQR
jgi:hypothetical protein